MRTRRLHSDQRYTMGFLPCKADPNVWMKDCSTHYESVCVYVNDLAVMMKDPSAFFSELRNRKYKLKGVGVGEISYHLVGDFYRDPDGTLAWGARTYCKQVVNLSESSFGHPPKEFHLAV